METNREETFWSVIGFSLFLMVVVLLFFILGTNNYERKEEKQSEFIFRLDVRNNKFNCVGCVAGTFDNLIN